MLGIGLAHDVLDAQLLDREKHRIGRVDQLLLTVEDGQPPCASAILIGGPARAERIGGWMVWLNALLHRLRRSTTPGVSRVPFSAVRTIGDTIELDMDEKSLPSEHLERWLAEHIVCHIPGAGGEQK